MAGDPLDMSGAPCQGPGTGHAAILPSCWPSATAPKAQPRSRPPLHSLHPVGHLSLARALPRPCWTPHETSPARPAQHAPRRLSPQGSCCAPPRPAGDTAHRHMTLPLRAIKHTVEPASLSWVLPDSPTGGPAAGGLRSLSAVPEGSQGPVLWIHATSPPAGGLLPTARATSPTPQHLCGHLLPAPAQLPSSQSFMRQKNRGQGTREPWLGRPSEERFHDPQGWVCPASSQVGGMKCLTPDNVMWSAQPNWRLCARGPHPHGLIGRRHVWDSTGGQGWEKHDLLSCRAVANRCCPEQKTKAMTPENWQMKHNTSWVQRRPRTNEIQLQAEKACRLEQNAEPSPLPCGDGRPIRAVLRPTRAPGTQNMPVVGATGGQWTSATCVHMTPLGRVREGQKAWRVRQQDDPQMREPGLRSIRGPLPKLHR